MRVKLHEKTCQTLAQLVSCRCVHAQHVGDELVDFVASEPPPARCHPIIRGASLPSHTRANVWALAD